MDTPRATRRYLNHHLDSDRWRVFEPRDDDIVVTTSIKSGTTWMQQILHGLVFQGDPSAPPAGLASPWLDSRFHGPLDEMAARLREQEHRRFVKSHLPFDGLPWHPKVKYVVVARDARDVFMSLWNHYSNYTDEMYARLNDLPERTSPPIPRAGDDPRALWRRWITEGWFPWESEGWPFWGNLHHTQTYWEHRELENVRLVHYADLLADPAGEIRGLADFLDVTLGPGLLERIVEGSSFDTMRKMYKAVADEHMRQRFRGGAEAFIYKGTNGRWREVLTEEDLALYEQAKARVLSPDCAAWLEQGRAAL